MCPASHAWVAHQHSPLQCHQRWLALVLDWLHKAGISLSHVIHDRCGRSRIELDGPVSGEVCKGVQQRAGAQSVAADCELVPVQCTRSGSQRADGAAAPDPY